MNRVHRNNRHNLLVVKRKDNAALTLMLNLGTKLSVSILFTNFYFLNNQELGLVSFLLPRQSLKMYRIYLDCDFTVRQKLELQTLADLIV
jgi:hypothetical protein